MQRVGVIIGSTRQGRAADAVVQWLKQYLVSTDERTFVWLDLREYHLPFLDEESEHPMVQKWREAVSSCDRFIIVTPEYNHGYSGVLKNAIDTLKEEWFDKKVGFVSYGGIAAGSRAVEQLRQVVVELRMIPVRDSVHIPNIWAAFTPEGFPHDTRLSHQIAPLLDALK